MDIDYLLFLQQFRESAGALFTQFMLLISDISTKGAAVCTVLIFWSVDRSLGYRIIANCLSGHLVNNFLKLTACVYRPWIREHKLIPAPQAVESATGYSFPSGHTQMAMSFYGSIAVHFRSGNPLVCVLCTVMILLTGFSRNYLGVHTPQDVFVSIMIGLILLYLNTLLFRKLSQNPELVPRFAAAGILIAVLLLVYFEWKAYPMDYVDGILVVDPQEMKTDGFTAVGAWIGFLTGSVIEVKFIRFTSDGSVLRRVVRSILGFPIPVLVFLVLKKPLYAVTGLLAGHLILYGFLMFYLPAVYPALFTYVEKRIPSGVS